MLALYPEVVDNGRGECKEGSFGAGLVWDCGSHRLGALPLLLLTYCPALLLPRHPCPQVIIMGGCLGVGNTGAGVPAGLAATCRAPLCWLAPQLRGRLCSSRLHPPLPPPPAACSGWNSTFRPTPRLPAWCLNRGCHLRWFHWRSHTPHWPARVSCRHAATPALVMPAAAPQSFSLRARPQPRCGAAALPPPPAAASCRSVCGRTAPPPSCASWSTC